MRSREWGTNFPQRGFQCGLALPFKAVPETLVATAGLSCSLKNHPRKIKKQSCKCQFPQNKGKCETPSHSTQERAAKYREGKWRPKAAQIASPAALIQQQKEVTQREKIENYKDKKP